MAEAMMRGLRSMAKNENINLLTAQENVRSACWQYYTERQEVKIDALGV